MIEVHARGRTARGRPRAHLIRPVFLAAAFAPGLSACSAAGGAPPAIEVSATAEALGANEIDRLEMLSPDPARARPGLPRPPPGKLHPRGILAGLLLELASLAAGH